ncbi:hypothetical protein ACI2LC_26215 [Nonomuraea wenchangensis]|uniref:hypothetical protein n=1 Tax=Nonomuraea wenchangensis TaxID=568860 RepID=UPI00340B5750
MIRQLADGEAPDRWYGWASAQQIDARVRAAAKMMTDLNGVASGNDGPAVKCLFRAG